MLQEHPMKTEKILLATTILAAAALSCFRLVNYAGAPAAVGDTVLGVANTNYAEGEQAGVARFVTSMGTSPWRYFAGASPMIGSIPSYQTPFQEFWL